MQKTNNNIKFIKSAQPIHYNEALSLMEQMHADVLHADRVGKVWLLEHNDVYTKGTSADDSDILDSSSIEVINTGRGGKITYHGLGQRIIYPILNLKKLHNNKPDIKLYVNQLENIIISSLADVGIKGYINHDRVGVWVKNGSLECKIAAIGIRVKKWVTYHGAAINVSTDLTKFNGIVPCGLKGFGVCSLKSLGCEITISEFDKILEHHFAKMFLGANS